MNARGHAFVIRHKPARKPTRVTEAIMNRQIELQSVPNPTLGKRYARGAIASSFAVVLMAFAGNAQAGNEFEDGFELELGRLAANHVVAISHMVLGLHAEPVVVEVRNVHDKPRHYRREHRGHHKRMHRIAHRKHQRRHAPIHWRGHNGHRGHNKFNGHRGHRYETRHNEWRRYKRHERRHGRRAERRHDRRHDRVEDRHDDGRDSDRRRDRYDRTRS